MTRKVRTHIANDASPDLALAPKHLTKQEFGRRLYSLMLQKGWKQSELARQADLPRDSISGYVRGKTLPTPGNLRKLAEALSVDPTAILPNHAESAIDEDFPSFEMRVSPSAPNTAWLRVNRLVTTRTAMKIMEALENDNAATDGG